jgi:ABC-type maltose transport system permease subunit
MIKKQTMRTSYDDVDEKTTQTPRYSKSFGNVLVCILIVAFIGLIIVAGNRFARYRNAGRVRTATRAAGH